MKRLLLVSTAMTIVLFTLLVPILKQLTNYLHPVVLGVVLICLWALLSFFVFLFRHETISISYNIFHLLLIIYTFLLLVLLFFRPGNQSYGTYNLMPFSTISFFLSGKVSLLIAFYNLTANIVLFIPFGILLMVRRKKTTKLALIYLPFMTISFIEVLQFITVRGNLDIDDLILNLCGVSLGYLVFPVFRRVIHISPRP